jgi:hypothetical protein
VFVTNHVLVGSLIGLALPRRPAVAFGAGVVSHYLCDFAPHWGIKGDRPRFLKYAVVDGLIGLTVMGAVTRNAPPSTKVAVVAGMAGAAFPDLDKPAVLFFGRSPFPRVADEFHVRIQHESPRRFKQEIATACGLASVFALCSRASAHRGRTPAA